MLGSAARKPGFMDEAMEIGEYLYAVTGFIREVVDERARLDEPVRIACCLDEIDK